MKPTRWNPLTNPKAPLDWRKPRRVEVVGDLFHEDVTDESNDVAFAAMLLRPQHDYLTWTDNAWNLTRYYMNKNRRRAVGITARELSDGWGAKNMPDWMLGDNPYDAPWPLPNLTLGIIASNQAELDARAELLLACPAARRAVWMQDWVGACDLSGFMEPLGIEWVEQIPSGYSGGSLLSHIRLTGGSEPLHPDTARGVRDACKAADCGFEFGGFGEWIKLENRSDWDFDIEPGDWFVRCNTPVVAVSQGRHKAARGELTPQTLNPSRNLRQIGKSWFRRVGSRLSGRLLDGVTHDDWPQAELIG